MTTSSDSVTTITRSSGVDARIDRDEWRSASFRRPTVLVLGNLYTWGRRNMLELTGKNTLALSISAALAAVAAPTGVFARGAQVLDEVVVTARKREESLQDMGMSVSALSGTEVEATFARDIGELANISPNLIIDGTSQGPGGVAAVTIRGIGIAEV